MMGVFQSQLINRIRKNSQAHRLTWMSFWFLVFISLLALFAPYVTKFSYELQNIDHKLLSPNTTYWLGTDGLGRDLYSRIIYGARMSLSVGVLTALLSLTMGTVVGAWAGFKGGWIDSLLMKIVDLFYIFPSILTAILLTVVMGRGFMGILLALALTSWVTHARLVRNQVLQMREMPFVESARAMGVKPFDVVVKHLLPNMMGPIIVSLTFQIPQLIMSESFLSFIGLGLQPPHSSWGTLASEGFRAMKTYPHLMISPGLVLFLTLMAFNYLGDGLRDLLDPKGKRDFSAS
jgi:oligopeptide transport system permease protein